MLQKTGRGKAVKCNRVDFIPDCCFIQAGTVEDDPEAGFTG